MFDLNALYLKYPRKRGKTPGIKKLTKDITTQADYLSLEVAIENYSKTVAATDPKFMLHFSTFAAQWRDWVDAEPETNFSVNVKPVNLDEL